MIKKILITLIFLIAIAAFIIGYFYVLPYAGYIPTFRFDAGNEGWWEFHSDDTVMNLSVDKESALKDSNSLRVDFKYAGAGSYLGTGVDFEYTDIKESLKDLGRFAKGGLVIYMKGSDNYSATVNLETENETYSCAIDIFPYRVKYSIPWGSFKSFNKGLDILNIKVKKIIIRPGDNTMEGKHSLFIDEIGFVNSSIKLAGDKMVYLTGIVSDNKGKGIKDAKVSLMRSVQYRFGLEEIDYVLTGEEGMFNIPLIYKPALSYNTKILEKTNIAEKKQKNTTESVIDDRWHFIEANFINPVEFDAINIVSCGHIENPEWNTRDCSFYVKGIDSKGWKLIKAVKNNEEDIIAIKLDSLQKISSARLEITYPEQRKQSGVARIYEIQFLKEGTVVPVKINKIEANDFDKDVGNPRFAFDGDMNTKWCSAKIKTKIEYEPDFYYKASAEGYQSLQEMIDLSKPRNLKNIKINLQADKKVEAKIEIYTNSEIREINPLIYGANVGIWAINDLIKPEMIDAIKELNLKVLRFPGGGLSQVAKWERSDADLYAREGDFECTMTPKHIDKFIFLCKSIDAEAMISVNVKIRDADMAADLVKYCNAEKGYNVRFFEIGNEPEDYVELWGFGNNWLMEPEPLKKTYIQLASCYLDYYEKMKEIDENILLLGPVSANRNYFPLTVPFFWEIVKDKLDVLSVHRYPQTDVIWAAERHYSDADLLKMPSEWTDICKELRQWEGQYSENRRPLYALTEWNNCYYLPGPRQWQLVGALYDAKNLCELIYNGFDIGCFWDLAGTGLYSLAEKREDEIFKPYPFYVFKILANNFNGKVVKAETNNPLLSVYAALNERALVIVVINTSPDIIFNTDIKIDEGDYTGDFIGYRMDEFNKCKELKENIGAKDGKRNYSFPAYSLTLLKFSEK